MSNTSHNIFNNICYIFCLHIIVVGRFQFKYKHNIIIVIIMADHTYSLTLRPASAAGLVTDDSTSSIISNLSNNYNLYFNILF